MFAPSPGTGPFLQSEILSGVIQTRVSVETLAGPEPQFEEIEHPFAIILTQHCDLEWDFKARTRQNGGPSEVKLVPNVLFCELREEDTLRGMQGINAEVWRRIKGNKDERFHFFPAATADADHRREGLPVLVADFKRLFTVPTEELYARVGTDVRRRAFLVSPHLQHLAVRFGYYCSRVALPENAPENATPQLPG